MFDHLDSVCVWAKAYIRLVPLGLALFLVGCGSSSKISLVTLSGPNISSISPTSGVVGTSVTISGSNFGSSQGTSTVTFNGTAASVATWTDSAIVTKVPSGTSSGQVIVTVGGTASNGVNFTVVAPSTGSLAASNFGFQCGLASGDCPNETWPSTPAQPGLFRMHDVGTAWGSLSTGSGTYDWSTLDAWLDVIAQHQPLDVIQVFSWVPCWDAPSPCEAPPVAPNGTNGPPKDLTAGGSASFNDFVTRFVQHCSPAGNCVKDFVKYYEMWNEWDAVQNGVQFRWGGTMNQLYQMLAPAVSIIRTNISGAVILTPSSFAGGKLLGPVPTDLQSWLNLETTNGRLSDWVVWHDYPTGNTPEMEWTSGSAIKFLSAQTSLSAWTSTPWADTETNFDPTTYACPSTFNANDCIGQIVRWQLLHASNGAMSLDWYKWNQTIGANSQYQAAYYYMMQYMVGGKFPGPCASVAGATVETWTCNFAEVNGTTALWVWTPNESGTSFTVPSGYIDYVDLTGAQTSVTSGQSITIGTMPFMLEQ